MNWIIVIMRLRHVAVVYTRTSAFKAAEYATARKTSTQAVAQQKERQDHVEQGSYTQIVNGLKGFC